MGAGGRRHCSWPRRSRVSRRRHHRRGREGAAAGAGWKPGGRVGPAVGAGAARGGGGAGGKWGFSLSAVLKGAARDAAVGARPGLRVGGTLKRRRPAAVGGRHGGGSRFAFKLCLRSSSCALVPPSCLFHFPLPETAAASARARAARGLVGKGRARAAGVAPRGHPRAAGEAVGPAEAPSWSSTRRGSGAEVSRGRMPSLEFPA